MATMIFVNLPVKDLDRSVAFFTGLGFTFNPQFTDENATCMVISDTIYVMLLVEKIFKTFTKKEVSDSSKTTESITSLFVDSREQVDELADKAMQAGAKPSVELEEMPGMYARNFEDLDGHLWEVGWMDKNYMTQVDNE
jgi:predicted lactoylglutathione lyase